MSRARPLAVVLGPAMAAAAGSRALAQTLAQGSDIHVSYWRVGAALLFCLALAAVAALAMRARLRGKSLSGNGLAGPRILEAMGLGLSPRPRRLALLDTLRVNPQLEICLFHYDGHDFLIAVSPQGAVLLDKTEAAGTDARP